MAAIKHKLETTYINLLAESDFALAVSVVVDSEIQRLGTNLVDVNYVLKSGTVVESDMDESRGLWNVHGATMDGVGLELTITVMSSECEIELLRIVKVRRSE